MLQIPPGPASLAQRWQELLVEPDVGIFFDLRTETALTDQQSELESAMTLVHAIGGDTTPILVRGVEAAGSNVVVVTDILDLRRRGTPFPHDALAVEGRPRVLVYQ